MGRGATSPGGPFRLEFGYPSHMAHHTAHTQLDDADPLYRIRLDGRWTLPDFASFSRVFNQAYSIILVIEYDGALLDANRRSSAFTSHAWRGAGFSAANFYHDVRAAVPRELSPRIQAIQYASPGFMELALLAGAALSVSHLVGRIVATFRHITDYYDRVYKQLHERKLTVIKTREEELNLLKKEHEFLKEHAEGLAGLMQFDQLEQLRELSGNDLATLKILLGLFRYLRQLAEWEMNGKAVLPKSDKEKSKPKKPPREK